MGFQVLEALKAWRLKPDDWNELSIGERYVILAHHRASGTMQAWEALPKKIRQRLVMERRIKDG
jgi:hypothetical protein